VEGLRAIVKKNEVPSVDSGTTVEGLRAFVQENDVLSVVSVTTVEGLRAFQGNLYNE
jgi:hypothetical protein